MEQPNNEGFSLVSTFNVMCKLSHITLAIFNAIQTTTQLSCSMQHHCIISQIFRMSIPECYYSFAKTIQSSIPVRGPKARKQFSFDTVSYYIIYLMPCKPYEQATMWLTLCIKQNNACAILIVKTVEGGPETGLPLVN